LNLVAIFINLIDYRYCDHRLHLVTKVGGRQKKMGKEYIKAIKRTKTLESEKEAFFWAFGMNSQFGS
jgi:hypothetical protein